jgi:hypothetical protein
MRHLLVLFAVSLAMLGCGTSVRYAATNSSARTLRPRTVESVEVFTAAPPARSYTEIGLLEAEQESGLSSDRMPELIAHLRTRAAEIGCDGLVLRSATDRAQGQAYGGVGSVYTIQGFTGTCVAWND